MMTLKTVSMILVCLVSSCSSSEQASERSPGFGGTAGSDGGSVGTGSIGSGGKGAGDEAGPPGNGGQAGEGAGSAGSSGATSGSSSNSKSPLGTNLSGIADFSTELPFVDAFKSSRGWVSGTKGGAWNDKRPLDLDKDGWVRSLKSDQVARTLMFTGMLGKFPGGKYVVLYKGNGTLVYSSGATKNKSESSLGRDVLDVDANKGGIGLEITKTDPQNPLRDIRVLMPGGSCQGDSLSYCKSDKDCKTSCVSFEKNYQKQIFNPVFLSRIKTYKVLRFMDWMETNHSEQAAWEQRPKASDAQWSLHGAPVEIMLELANRLNADPWFCMPHKATNDYVSKFAQAVRSGLSTNLRPYVEYSNEVWNGIFSQAVYAQNQGLLLKLSTTPWEARSFYYAKRSVEVFDLWSKVYQGSGEFTRVLASQSANQGITKKILLLSTRTWQNPPTLWRLLRTSVGVQSPQTQAKLAQCRPKRS